MFTSLLLAALATVPCADTSLQLVETAPIETTLGSDSIPEARDVWLEMIGGAKEQINIAQFYISDRAPSNFTPVVAAIEEAADRGVRVSILAERVFQKTYPELLERFGARENIEVRLYDIKDQTGGILHAKYFTVDQRLTYLGSQNFDWRSLEHIQELGVRVDSKVLTESFDEIFLYDWALAGGDEMRILTGPSSPSQTVGDLIVTPVFSPKELCPRASQWDLPQILKLIDEAQSTVRIQLLNYKAKNRDRSYFGEIEQALRAAAARKVHVELLLADWSKSRGTIEGLQSLQVLPNIDIKLTTLPEWSGGFIDFARVMHSKYMVVDGKGAWIGTSNWSGDYFYASRNVGLIVRGESFGKQLDEYFLQGWSSEYATLVDPCAKYTAPKRQ